MNWAREFSVVAVRYRLFAEAAEWLGAPAASAADRNDGALVAT